MTVAPRSSSISPQSPTSSPNDGPKNVARTSLLLPRKTTEHDPNLHACWDFEWDPSAYSLYLKYANKDDSNILSRSNADTDILSIFAGIFSAVVALFLVRSLDDLKEDYSQTSSTLLGVLVAQSLDPNVSFTPLPPFQPKPSSIVVNSFFAVSIILSVSTALGAILCKQWLREYTARLSPVPSIRAFQRHRRYKAFKRWQVSEFIALLPVMLHVAVALFFAALAINLTLINRTVSIVALTMIGTAYIVYVLFFILPFFTEAPFITPLTHLVKNIASRLTQVAMWLMLPLAFCVASCFEPYICGLQFCTTMWSRIIPAGRLFQRLLVLARKARDDSETNIGLYHGEIPRAELASWLMHCALEDGDIEDVVKALSGIQSRHSLRMLESDGVEVLLMHRMRSAYFYPCAPGDTMKVIPEYVPAAMACLEVWFRIVAQGVFESGHHSSESEAMIKALSDAPNLGGHGKLRVLAASQWIFHFETQPEYRECRNRIRDHLTAHIAGDPELPDDIVRILVDDPYPAIEYLPTVMELLDNYLENDKLPSIECIRAILRHMCTRDIDSAFGIRAYPVSRLLALLLERGNHRPRLLRLIRALSSPDPQSIKDAYLAEALVNLLHQSPPLDEAEATDVWETISCAPQACVMHDQALLSFVKLHRQQASSSLFRASTKAIAAVTEYLVYQQSDGNHDKELARTAGIIAECVTGSPEKFTGIDILLPSVYVLSLTNGYWRMPTTLPLVTEILPHLTNILSTPHSERDIATMQHALRVMDGILSEDMSKGATLTHSLTILQQLAICDDIWIRWLSFSVLKRVSFHLTLEERRAAFEVVRRDVERRLNSEEPVPFIDRGWRDITDGTKLVPPKSKPPVVAQALAVECDIHSCGIRQLLEGAPDAALCHSSVYTDLPWLFPFNTWVRDNQ